MLQKQNWLLSLTIDQTLNYCQSWWMDISSRGICALREYWASKSHPISSGTRIYDPLLKMQVKWLAPCIALVSIWILMLSSIRSKMEYCCHIWLGTAQTWLSWVLSSKASSSPCGRRIFFHLPTSLSQVECGKSLTVLLLLLWKILRWTKFLGSARSNFHS